jgi:hypothetical protein
VLQGAAKQDVTYVKLYLMVINVTKVALLIVGALGPKTVLCTVVSGTSGLPHGWYLRRWPED